MVQIDRRSPRSAVEGDQVLGPDGPDLRPPDRVGAAEREPEPAGRVHGKTRIAVARGALVRRRRGRSPVARDIAVGVEVFGVALPAGRVDAKIRRAGEDAAEVRLSFHARPAGLDADEAERAPLVKRDAASVIRAEVFTPGASAFLV